MNRNAILRPLRLAALSLLGATTLALSACDRSPDWARELGASADEGGFGAPTRNNTEIMSGERDYVVALGERFAREVPTTITFEFDSARLTPEAIAILRQQADWIKRFPEVRFRVYGHTDKVGSEAYNRQLGKRRAEAVVDFFARQGISRSRLEALVSYGEDRPLVYTEGPEERNRRTVTEVSGFVKRHPTVMNGKYAEIVFREYVASATAKPTVEAQEIASGG
ncbi:Outer membrane protein OmpA [Meinhardsimonia xiamenensis]|jgi:outer membrane protein OmpA-like peptidoglycan-associated protein|uniref:Outer membrane protein OmpA n=1 Tax=Meinhardsimonia xiamenensis TaxID=990712 RepID=A0A1G9CMT2_9RHOB|nr:OmpA family protein [Meinhardsimonia xiamenensis]PRX38307.1 outer membrane protein OmpA-like peptidoglycan-associated protein [Meinhardsimonia xiamenensis]SDK52899.1 Outer membrane protein OmpA [Meinhardsimonia xiamenensis]